MLFWDYTLDIEPGYLALDPELVLKLDPTKPGLQTKLPFSQDDVFRVRQINGVVRFEKIGEMDKTWVKLTTENK